MIYYFIFTVIAYCFILTVITYCFIPKADSILWIFVTMLPLSFDKSYIKFQMSLREMSATEIIIFAFSLLIFL